MFFFSMSSLLHRLVSVRVYLAMLPILSICDMLAAALAFLAIVNPLRCGAFLRLMSAKWNDKLVAWYVQMALGQKKLRYNW